MSQLLGSGSLWAACGANDRVWDGSTNTAWDNANNWTLADVPDTSSENAIIESASRTPLVNKDITLSCLEILSGRMRCRDNKTLTITGDYFSNLVSGSLDRCSDTYNYNFVFLMAGSGDQTFENVDNINYLTISNNNTVTLKESFTINNVFSLTGSTTTVVIEGDLTLGNTATAFVIPSGVTVEVSQGATFTVSGGITVNGTLTVESGSKITVGGGKTIQVNSGGALNLTGSSGSVASLVGSGSGSSFTLNIAGTINASYFRIDRLDAAGVNVTGTIQGMDNGEFHYLASNGYALTLGSGAIVPSDMDYVGFFDDDGHGNTQSFNASSFNSPSAIGLDEWSGDAGGEDNDNDPFNSIDWETEAGTKLTLSNNTASGNPSSPILQSSGDTLFATFAFALTGADTATNITSVTLTMAGTASVSDLDVVKVYKDAGAGTSCVYDSGQDTQIGSDLILSGSPPTVTVTIPSGDVQTSSTTPACIHVITGTSSSAQDAKTIYFQIAATGDVTNSAGYSFSEAAGPPVNAPSATTSGDAIRKWDGSNSNNWNVKQNWIGDVPDSTSDCQVGPGTNHCQLNVAQGQCQNADLPNGGELDFMSTTNELAVYGSLTIGSTYTFTNAGSGVIALRGSGNQTVDMAATFPGDMIIANTGTSPANKVTFTNAGVVSGDVSVATGVLKIESGATLTVMGNLTVASGATLEIAGGGTLQLGNGSVLTVNGTLSMVGSSGQLATMSSDQASSAYNVVVNGSILAQYYTFDHLGTAGLSIESAATIDSTYHLQNGNFTYPVGSGGTMLFLKQQVPTNSMDNMNFDLNGSSATGTTSIDTTGASAGTLSITTYTGDLAGPSYDSDPTYNISWAGASNTINLTQEATGASTFLAGATYTMGRFGFQQKLAGVSFNDTDVTQLKLTLLGTGSSSDIDEIRVYYDSDCDSSGGTLIGTGTYSGSPAVSTFNFSASAFTVPADASSPAMRCIYVQYDISVAAGNGNTVGVKITASGDMTNSESYGFSSDTLPPKTLGTAGTITGSSLTNWLGSTSTDWFTATNWSNGVPDSTLDCNIFTASNNPVIGNTATAACKSVTISSGSLTLQNGVGAALEVYGSFTAGASAFIQNDGTLTIRDNGAASSTQTIDTPDSLSLVFNKTAGGEVRVGSTTLTLSSLTIPIGSNFDFIVASGKTLVLTGGATITAGVLSVDQNATLKVAASQTITVNGGTFQTTGVNDSFPQATGSKALITNNGSGRWAFTATSGTVDLTGFIFEYLDVNGLSLSGSANLTNLNGGQFTRLSQDFATPMKAIQLNTSGGVPTTATNVGFMWDDANSRNDDGDHCNCNPTSAQSYFLVYAPDCGSATITFNQWFGDFFIDAQNINTEDKMYDDADGGTCSLNMAASASPISLSEFTATPYKKQINLDWQTTAEIDHLGFNVYRSHQPYQGFVQVNSQLIRNILSSSQRQGVYRFYDKDVVNNVAYYYYIEDIAINGAKTWHGPVSATPLASLDDAPTGNGTTNDGSSDTDAGNGNDLPAGGIHNPDVVDLGNGVHVLEQSSTALRVQILPPLAVFEPSTWDVSYDVARVPGYSFTTEAGYPQLPQRTILVEVEGQATDVKVIKEEISELAVSSHKVLPAPSWLMDGDGKLVATYAANAAAYTSAQYTPTAYYKLNPKVIESAGKRYVELTVFPLRFKASSEEVATLDTLVLDIDLDNQGWQVAEANVTSISPSAIENTLRIGFKATGYYEVSGQDLYDAAVDGPFLGADVNSFVMYFKGQQIPIEIESADGIFDEADVIRFFVVYETSIFSDESEVVLSPKPLFGEGEVARIGALDGDPTLFSEWHQSNRTRKRAVSEQNNDAPFDRPIGSIIDRFFSGRIFVQEGTDKSSAPGYNKMDINIDLPKLDADENHYTTVYSMIAARGASSVNPIHSLGVRVNGSTEILGEKSFSGNGVKLLGFRIPSHLFKPGNNTITLQAVGDLLPSQEWSIIDVDKVFVDFVAFLEANNGVMDIFNAEGEKKIQVDGFTSNQLHVIDASTPENVAKIENFQTVDQGDGTHSLITGLPGGADGEFGYHVYAYQDDALAVPTSLRIAKQFTDHLSGSLYGADLVVIGTQAMLDAARPLISRRIDQGLTVIPLSLHQLYAEFSDGRPDVHAVRNMIEHAYGHWTKKPRYLLFLGDASYDPLDHWGNNPAYEQLPMPFVNGQFLDFGSDHWFAATDEDGNRAKLAVGRIPAVTPHELSVFVDKLIGYENNQRIPDEQRLKELLFISDKSDNGEGFDGMGYQLAETTVLSREDFQADILNRAESANDAAFVESIKENFERAPLGMVYVGHGSEGSWSGGFDLTEISQLDHGSLPFVMALNCLNAFFVDPNQAARGLGESLIFQEDGGAVMFIGSTAMTTPYTQMTFAHKFIELLGKRTNKPDAGVRWGDLFTDAKVAIASQPGHEDTVGSFLLMGDPSAPLPASLYPDAPPISPKARPKVDDSRIRKGGDPDGGKTDPASAESGGGSGGASCGVLGTESHSSWLLLLVLLAPLLRRRREPIV